MIYSVTYSVMFRVFFYFSEHTTTINTIPCLFKTMIIA